MSQDGVPTLPTLPESAWYGATRGAGTWAAFTVFYVLVSLIAPEWTPLRLMDVLIALPLGALIGALWGAWQNAQLRRIVVDSSAILPDYTTFKRRFGFSLIGINLISMFAALIAFLPFILAFNLNMRYASFGIALFFVTANDGLRWLRHWYEAQWRRQESPAMQTAQPVE